MVQLANGDAGPGVVHAVGGLSAKQLALFYLLPPRGEHGQVSFPPTVVGRPMGAAELFRYRCFLLGIRDPETVAALWAEERAKR